MSWAQVGSASAVVTGVGGFTVTPAQAPTAGNFLLVFVVTTDGNAGASNFQGFWRMVHLTGLTAQAEFFGKVATGSEGTSPLAFSYSNAGNFVAQLVEFSGNATTGFGQFDGGLPGTIGAPGDNFNDLNTPSLLTIGGSLNGGGAAICDVQPGDLIAVICSNTLSKTGTTTTTIAAHDGSGAAVSLTSLANNDAVSATQHYRWGWGVCSGSALTTDDTGTVTTSSMNSSDLTMKGATFFAPLPGAPQMATFGPRIINAAPGRASSW